MALPIIPIIANVAGAVLGRVAQAKGPNAKANAATFSGGIMGLLGVIAAPSLVNLQNGVAEGLGSSVYDFGLVLGTVIGAAVFNRLTVWISPANKADG